MASWTLDTVCFTPTTPVGEKFLKDFENASEKLIEQSQYGFVLLTDILRVMGVELPTLEICNACVRVSGVTFEGETAIIYTRAPGIPPIGVMTMIAILYQLQYRVVSEDYMLDCYIDTDSSDNADLIAKIEKRIIEELEKRGIVGNLMEQWG